MDDCPLASWLCVCYERLDRQHFDALFSCFMAHQQDPLQTNQLLFGIFALVWSVFFILSYDITCFDKHTKNICVEYPCI